MKNRNSLLIEQLNEILPLVEKPGRYVGGEFNQVVKDWDHIKVKIGLVFPDIYEIGLSNLGLAILYELINDREDALAERFYSPWIDMEKILREKHLPVFSLESQRPMVDFDIIGISIPYESLYTNVLNILNLGNIPLLTDERDQHHPLVLAGGNSTFNPEPMHAFIDAFVIGDGEKIIHTIIDVYRKWKTTNNLRNDLLQSLSKLEGVYIPSFYNVDYSLDGMVKGFVAKHSHLSNTIKRQMVNPLPPAPVNFLVPNIDTTHNRIAIEIMRGCTRGCRFCQAGMINRPFRERTVDEIIDSIKKAIKNTGFEEISLLSLSSSDYTQLPELIAALDKQFCGQNITISLPSLRIDSFSVEMMESLKGRRHGSFTFAPEAASERLRNLINKTISSEQLLSVSREVFKRGWPTIKLYFMIGFPDETIEDIEAIADLCNHVLRIGIEEIGNRATLNISVNNFIPKPHTPFQWVAQDGEDAFQKKQQILKKRLHNKKIKINWSDNENALLEACLSRGDRRISKVILDAWKNSAKFDAWHDHFKWSVWETAFEKNHIDPKFYSERMRDENEVFPWDHINTGVQKKVLYKEYKSALKQEIRKDCREECYGCGIQAAYHYICNTDYSEEYKN